MNKLQDNTDRLIEALSELDCGGNPCYFAKDKSGQRTQGGCTCMSSLPQAVKVAIGKIWFGKDKNLNITVEKKTRDDLIKLEEETKKLRIDNYDLKNKLIRRNLSNYKLMNKLDKIKEVLNQYD